MLQLIYYNLENNLTLYQQITNAIRYFYNHLKFKIVYKSFPEQKHLRNL